MRASKEDFERDVDRRLNHSHSIIALIRCHPLLRWDTMPFMIAYGAMIAIDCGVLAAKAHVVRQWVHVIIFPAVLICHVGVFFASQWSIGVRSAVGYRRASTKANERTNRRSWTHCLVIPPNPVALSDSSSALKAPVAGTAAGSTEIVPISVEAGGGEGGGASRVLKISYQQVAFRCCETGGAVEAGVDRPMDAVWRTAARAAPRTERHGARPQTSAAPPSVFHRIHFPIDLPLPFYTARWRGHATPASLRSTRKIYADNTLHITVTKFSTLLAQQLVAPFFLFQVFCVLLWSMDEFYIYAIFTLFTLVIFECTIAFTRLKNLKRLRETLRPPYSLWTYRSNMWKLASTDDLVAGDILSLTSLTATRSHHASHHAHDHGLHVPADILLLRGGAVVNEAMLTGESVPQIKESIDLVASASIQTHPTSTAPAPAPTPTPHTNEPRLDIEDPNHKRAILFGGTLLVNHSSASGTATHDDDAAPSPHSSRPTIPPPPDNGCIGFILRTGFETQQGSLLRTMIHTSTKSQNDGVNTKDTFLFILILLVCAIASAALILHHGWNDPTRNRFKLVLHVVIIITSVVPPELPMELSLAVTTSLADLIKRCSVYCTEPFRIPIAGMVDTCAFDKTGTLTSDQMVLRGVRLTLPSRNGTTTSNVEMAHDLVLPSYDADPNANPPHDIDNPIDGVPTASVPIEVLRVMVACQSLALNHTRGSAASDAIIGDPLEKAVFLGCKSTLLSNCIVSLPQRQGHVAQTFNIFHRFAFTSKLKRMTVIAGDLGRKDLWVLTKGAPETIKELLKPHSIPASYDSVSRYHMSLGQRVLAMGYKKLDSKLNVSEWKKRGRQLVECDLVFAGFLILDCPLKPDSKRIITELRQSGHDTVMITGDAVLTAAEVARQVGIIKSQKRGEATYELRECVDKTTYNEISAAARFEFVPLICGEDSNSDPESITYSQSNLSTVKEMIDSSKISAICVSGDVLAKLSLEAVRLAAEKNGTELPYIDPKTVLFHPNAQASLQKLVPFISVFARHAPRQKEAVIAAFNGAGRVTLMCGDGTNDVGALKMSHVGISIISVPGLETKQMEAMKGMRKVREEERIDRKKNKKNKKNKYSSSGVDEKLKIGMKKKKNRKKNFEQHLKALAETEEELCNVALGDASISSPFTSRTTSIKCTKDILQRGRCTLVTMIQIYKILGVNCLVNALILSSLHIEGVKQGDSQLTVVGLVVAALFFFVTKGQPLKNLSPERPPSSVLCKQVVLSIVMQFTIHFLCIMFVTELSKLYLDPYDPSLIPDGQFNPNTLNTATFLMTVLTMVNTFLVNYPGHPFVENLRDNKLLLQSLKVCYAVLFTCTLELFPPLNELLQLAPLPHYDDKASILTLDVLNKSPPLKILQLFEPFSFKTTLVTIMLIDSLASYYAERGMIRIFERRSMTIR